MFRFISKTLRHSRNGYSYFSTNRKSSMALSLSLRFLSTDSNRNSFTVSYLMNSCGLSSESAASVSKSVQFEIPDKPDLILSFFGNLGFSTIQISQMIIKFPKLLSLDPHKIIFPKVELFRSKGASNPDLASIFTCYPWILGASLEKKLVLSLDFLIELFQSECKAIEAVKLAPRLVCGRPETYLAPNLNTLRENKVPAATILFMVRYHSRSVLTNPVKFREIVEEAKEMGLSPVNSQFVAAISALNISKSKRDVKVDVYKKWGWSNKDITTAFVKYPWCMAISEDKLTAVMDFYVNKLGLDSSVIMNTPLLLGLSLKKRLIPRGEVLQFLASKGLVQLDSSVTRMFKCTEKYFLEKYVDCYEEAPHLMKLYNQKLSLSDARQSAKVKRTK